MTTPPQTLVAGRYRLLEPAGSGGMGRVWLATDEVLGREVAIKEVVTPDGLAPDEVRDMGTRALREARAAARLSHPNVITVYDVVVDDGAPWIVMEYLPSRSLAQVVNEDGPMSPEEVARIGLAMLGALRAAHKVGVLHRDVKPANVLMADKGRVVLTDFGVATIIGDPSVTRSGLVIGSPSYMAPERLREDVAVGAPADLWSLGATLYFAVEGRSPYQRTGAIATVAALASEEPDAMTRAGALAPVIDVLLRRDPSARPSAATVERMLRPVAYPVAPGTLAPPSRRRPRVATAGAAATAATAATSPTAVVARPQPERPLGARPDRRAWLAGAVAVLALIALAAWALTRPAGTPAASGPDATSTTPAPTTSAGPPAGPPAGPGPTGTATASPAGITLPAGWHMYRDRTGFAVAVPRNWTVSRRGTIVYFSEPGGGRLLGIDQTDRPQPDPVADWAGKEAYRVQRGDFPSYRRVRLVAVDYFRKAADWEFTYLRNGQRLHVNNRGFITSPTQAYGMWWSTPDSRWDQYLPDLRLIQRTFVPVDDS
jgi:eukaryotic-like serine/threonine-protein kinase